METKEEDYLAKPLVYTSIKLNGKDLTFVIWPDFNRSGDQESDFMEASKAAGFIRDELNEERGSLSGSTNGLDTRQLGFERPIAVVTTDENGRFQLTKPGEFEEEEIVLREAFAKYIRNKNSA